MSGSSENGLRRGVVFVEEFVIVFGLIGVQVIYGVYSVFLSRILALGLNPLFLVICASLSTTVFLAPFAVALERKKWPGKLSPRLMLQFVLIAMGGVTAFQALMMLGIEKTSPAMASAMPNLAPGLIFIIAACLRFERVDVRCNYSRAKILGTLMCLTGAIAMSFLQKNSSTVVAPTLTTSHAAFFLTKPLQQENAGAGDWIVGCIYLMLAVFLVSCTMVLQAYTMNEFPAPLSLCAMTSLIGAILTAVVQLIAERKFDVGSPVIGVGAIACLVLMGGIMSGICIAFQTWSVKKRGPVLVSMFSPIATVCSAVLSALTLGQVMNRGRYTSTDLSRTLPVDNLICDHNLGLAGMLVMFTGLYFVLWAKKKEAFSVLVDDSNGTPQVGDIEKPLLS